MINEPLEENHLYANILLEKLIFDIYNENNGLRQNRYPALMQLLVELKRTLDKWWNVPEMAEFCNLSESHLRRIFHEHTGLSPKSYVDRLKMQKSCELLTQTSMTLAEISNALGYIDPFL